MALGTTGCFCAEVWAPVCGVDGKTYSNACHADCARVKYTPGACEDKKPDTLPAPGCAGCPRIYKPVCGFDDKTLKTYSNDCTRRCAVPSRPDTAKLAHTGACTTCDSLCPKLHAPVCSTKNETFGNACFAACQGSRVDYLGTCRARAKSKGPLAAAAAATAAMRREGCVCIALYAPVCAVDPATRAPRTFGNSCNAACAGAAHLYNGECRSDEAGCICTMEYMPVCGSDGNTYGNKCQAACKGITRYTEGPCSQECQVCTKEYNPQCGMDGKTYGNKCMLRCANPSNPGSVQPAYAGECKPFCTQACRTKTQYKPVCKKQSDGSTSSYGNSCYAICNGVGGATAATCPKPTCAARGQTCSTGPANSVACCGTDVCYNGPVARPNTPGVCVDKNQPRPVG